MGPKLRFMLDDLRELKRDMMGATDADGKDIPMEDLDDFKRGTRRLTLLLADIRESVKRLNELRANAPDSRDLTTIRICNDNSKELKKAGEIWKALRDVIAKEEKKRGVDLKTIADRKSLLTTFANEIKELSDKNAHVKPTKRSEADINFDKKRDEREKRRRDREARKRKQREESGEKGSETEIGEDDIRPVQPATVEEQKFYDEVDQNKKEQDEILQEILKGVTELHEIAVGIGVGLDTGKELIKEVDKKKWTKPSPISKNLMPVSRNCWMSRAACLVGVPY